MSDKVIVKTTSSGIGFTGLLTIAFIVLKLCKVISWSWFWVLFPTILPIGIGLAFLAIWAIVVLITFIISLFAIK